jgi:hypothetical protein
MKSAPRTRTTHHSQRDRPRGGAGLEERVNDALTDLSAYALRLDIECHRLDRRFDELTDQESSAAERRALVQERAEIAEEISAFRRIIAALHEQFPQC